jgi:hypothetical protein
MMKRFMGLSLAVCFAAMISSTVAHAEPGITMVVGSGQLSCGQFIAAIADAPPGKHRELNTAKGVFVSEHKAHEEWLLGFVSGFNYAHPTDGDDME